jgi:3-oxoacyl-[acyl-carrier-protein] synthase-1
MSTEALITSAGIISAIGNNIPETLASFEQHRSGIRNPVHLNTIHRDEFPCGEVNLSNAELAVDAGLEPHLSRTILLSHHAAREAMAPFAPDIWSRFRTGFISASTVGGMDKTENFAQDFIANSASGDIRQVIHHDCGKGTDVVAISLGIRHLVTTVSTACSSSANSIMLAARLIRSGRLDIAIAGGVDSLTRFTLNGFNSLMILDREQCRPFDNSRAGLNLGEGAAYVVLMSERVAAELGAAPVCRLSGYGNTCDAFHQTAISEEGKGPGLAMTKALEKSGLKPSDISYINLHGTGTPNNDPCEARAVLRLFGEQPPPMSSTKSFTGHTLGASGAVEAVLSVLSIQHGLIFPNFSFVTPMDNPPVVPETKFRKEVEVSHVLSNSFGFGGNCTSLVFSKL